MPDFVPFEVVLDYDADKVIIDGTELPCPLSLIGAKAITEDGRATVTLTLEVDQVRSVAAPPPAPEPAPEPPPTAEQQFEQRLAHARSRRAQS